MRKRACDAENISSIAKITRPRISGIVPRQRLFDRLDCAAEKPVTWISGPGGSGKTTLVASYLDARKLPCLWYEMDDGDGDAATFFYYLGLAAKKAVPRARKPPPLLTSEYVDGITAFTRRYFEDLYLRLRTPFTLVFDGYQNAPPGSRIHEIVKEAVSILPDGIRAVLVSRSAPPPEFARLRANGEIDFLGWNDLRFTLDEARDFLASKGMKPCGEETLKYLSERTEGWAAGMVLLLEEMENDVEAPAATDYLGRTEIFDYFAKEIIDKCQADIREFLIETSFLPKMTPRMTDELTGGSRGRRILAELGQKNYFTVRAARTEVYRYHPLFREFLLARAGESFPPERILRIRRTAAGILEAEGDTEDALTLLQDAGEWNDVTRLVLAQAPLLVAQGRGQTLSDWIRRIPPSRCEENPFLYYWLGISRMPYDPQESRRHLETAFQFFKRRKDATGIFLAFSGAMYSIVQGLDTFKQFDRWITVLPKLLDEYGGFPSEEIEAGVTMSMLYAFCLRQPQHPDYEAWSRRALALLQTAGDNTTKLQMLLALALHRLFSGELSKAAAFIHSFREAAGAGNINPLALVALKDIQAQYSWLSADFEERTKTATEGLELASFKGIHLFDSFLAGHGTAGALSAGDMNIAERFLRSMTPCLYRPMAWAKNLYHILMSWKAMLQKDVPQALLHAELSAGLTVEVGMPQIAAVTHLGAALVMHEMKKDKEAADHIGEVHRISRSTNIFQTLFRCLLAEAQFALDREDRDEARALLKKAMTLGREQGYASSFFWLPAVMARLCAEALDAGIEVDYVRSLVRKRGLVPETPSLACDNWPWPLRLRTLGGFALTRAGKPLAVPQKSLAILKALVSFGGRDVSGERLAYELWPDSQGDAARTSLEVNLHRLRRLLGSKNAVQLRAGSVSLDPHSFWVDIWVLQQLHDEIGRHLKETEEGKGRRSGRVRTDSGKDEILRLANKTLGLYKGHFLPSDTSCSWTLAPREAWRSKFLRIIALAGSYLEDIGEYESAAGFFVKGLEADSLAEEFYRHLMVCYRELGRKAEAAAVYNRCCGVLSAALGAQPRPATKDVYASLRRDQQVKPRQE